MKQRVFVIATGSFPKPRHFPAKTFLSVVHILTIAVVAGKTGVRNKCTADKTNRCNECLRLGPECGWCFQKDFPDELLHRCDLITNLIQKGCNSDFIEFLEVKKIMEEESQSSQLSASKVSLQLQPGWRKDAKHLLLLITDQLSHLALDSKLGGIVLPNDGNCHLKDNMYTHSTIMEHPSVGLLVDKLLENNIHVIFAVQGSCINWYKDLLPLMPGAVAKQLNAEFSNLSELLEGAYKTLLSEVELQVDNLINGVYVNITAICPDGTEHPGHNKCKNVKASDIVSFNITVGMTDCYEGDKYIILKPVGYNETTVISAAYVLAMVNVKEGNANATPAGKVKAVTVHHPSCLAGQGRVKSAVEEGHVFVVDVIALNPEHLAICVRFALHVKIPVKTAGSVCSVMC
ncbi:hypothetical protein scyTo_0001533 [Scyliorhinus torazame]|uniref:Integrin beta n=1 Tax=Scyliorhinus torazame TaxID=75743 RepID=A0A401PE05_SCYTO|nr:hypothetical protein [Scyliorhinus torazame]